MVNFAEQAIPVLFTDFSVDSSQFELTGPVDLPIINKWLRAFIFSPPNAAI